MSLSRKLIIADSSNPDTSEQVIQIQGRAHGLLSANPALLSHRDIWKVTDSPFQVLWIKTLMLSLERVLFCLVWFGLVSVEAEMYTKPLLMEFFRVGHLPARNFLLTLNKNSYYYTLFCGVPRLQKQILIETAQFLRSRISVAIVLI